jgi:5-methylcytosine-specific restriction endonuclease McrA
VKDVACSICGTVRPLVQNAREEGFACSSLCRLIRNGELPVDAADRLPSQPCAACEKPVRMNRNFTQARYCDEKCSRLAARNRKMGRPENTQPSGGTCKVCGVETTKTASTGPLPDYCVAHQPKQSRKGLGFWLPRHGVGTCSWCGDWFGRTKPDQRGCLGECSLRLRRASQPAEARHRMEHRNCKVCGDKFQTTMKRRALCGKPLCRARSRPWTPEGWKVGKPSTDRYLARRRAAVEIGDRDLTTLAIYLKAGGVCAACGIDTLHPQTPRSKRARERYNWATLDHIKPLIQGGSHTWDNAQLLCLSCNSRKAHTDRKALQSVPA